MSKRVIPVLVMAYGTPASLGDVEAYYTHIRRGHPPTAEKLQELKDRYEAIGGVSPLTEITDDQIKSLERRLNECSESYAFRTYTGLKHVYPFIADGVEAIVKDGFQEAISIVLAPHYSAMSIGVYNKYVKEAAEKFGLATCVHVNSYHLEPNLIEALVIRVQRALEQFPPEERSTVKVLFTAHSLPEKILEMNDPYPQQLRETAQAIANRVGLTNWDMGWQSAGQTSVPWLGPDIQDQMKLLHEQEGLNNLIICPIGFVSDHLEVLYDIDIECQQLAKELGMHLVRTASLNTDPLYIEALANTVLQQVDKLED